MNERRIVAVSAGLGQPSATRLLADRLGEAVGAGLGDQGLEAAVETIELRPLAHAIVDAMLTGFPAGELREAIEKVTGADALILVTPIFTTTYSGLFKSFLDILDKDSLAGVPVLLGATGGTARHSLALEYSLRPLLTYLRAEAVPTSVFAATEDWAAGGEGETGSVALPTRIRRAGRELAAAVVARPSQTADDVFADAPSFEELMKGL